MIPRLSSEMLHATTIAKHGRAILIGGRSGSGKSDLALRLLDRGFVLVSDDQTQLRVEAGKLLATAPPNIKGKLEVRGIGIIDVGTVDDVPVCLMVELATEVERMPDAGQERLILGMRIPLLSIDSMPASAAAKVELALERFGLPA